MKSTPPAASGVTSTPTEHLFTGKERDSESGNDYFGARYYSSSMGRFLSPDYVGDGLDPTPVPWANYENPQTMNLYSYVLNNPLTSTDPDGNDCVVQSSTSDTTETVSVSSGNCDNVNINTDEGQTKTYVPGTVTSISVNGGNSIDIGYNSYDGQSSGVTNASAAPIPDNQGIAYNWGNNAQGYQTLGVAGATMNDPRTYLLWEGASAAGALCGLYCVDAGATAIETYTTGQEALSAKVIAYLESRGMPATAAALAARKMLASGGFNRANTAIRFYAHKLNQIVQQYRQCQAAGQQP